MSRGVSEILEKKMRDFLWEGFEGSSSIHLVSWEQTSMPKEFGGLGIGNLLLRNKALLGKWWWRFPKEMDSLWGRVIASMAFRIMVGTPDLSS